MPTLTLNKSTSVSIPDMRKFIIQWNNTYPWDYLWRKLNNVTFGSPKHLATSFISMKFELREAQIHENRRNTDLNEKRKKPLTPAQQACLLKPALEYKFDDEITDEEFDDFDLSQFNTLPA
jgi:hypothetical protein